ncbi:threonine--tRNA ligase [bacterium]|nr:threonine--tRNA ligase [bacterium]
MKITFPNGSSKDFEAGSNALEIAKSLSNSLAKSSISAKVNGEPYDLTRQIFKDSEIEILTADSEEGLDVLWHSTTHLMAQAVKELYPNAKLGVGPTIENGFYYDIYLEDSLSVNELEKIEAKMLELSKKDYTVTRKELSKAEAVKFFGEMKEDFKVELINSFEDENVSTYSQGGFTDLCRGPHVVSTGVIKYFKLLNVSAAYWRGDEKNASLQRIYGISFPKKQQLDDYLFRLEEAKKRDHKKLGKQLGLFSFHNESPAMPFWHPMGMRMLNQIMNYWKEIHYKHGYSEVRTPFILDETLWHKSGHYDNYKENMYFINIDEKEFAVKPMNCPGHCLIFKNEKHSYKEFPIKFAELGIVHRNEKSGVTNGLFRVRHITQDDAHIFCTHEQIETEVCKVMDLLDEIYKDFHFNEFNVELSTRPAKSIGTDEMWQNAEGSLANALKSKGINFKLNPGDGAFYGPKIDIHIKDALGRSWQCGTVQLDFSMPARFELSYIGEDGNEHTPVMIHRAILGSIERFVGILIEHYAGDFPTWLAPVQVGIIPVSEKFEGFAKELSEKLEKAKIRVKFDNRSEKVGYKIREGELEKIRYLFVIGENEVGSNIFSIRKRHSNELLKLTAEEFIDYIQQEIIDKN